MDCRLTWDMDGSPTGHCQHISCLVCTASRECVTAGHTRNGRTFIQRETHLFPQTNTLPQQLLHPQLRTNCIRPARQPVAAAAAAMDRAAGAAPRLNRR